MPLSALATLPVMNAAKRAVPPVGKAGRPSLSKERADRVVAAMRQIVSARYSGVATRLAEALDIKQASVSNYFSGKTRPSYQTAEAVARIAGVDVSELLDGPGKVLKLDRYPNRSVAHKSFRAGFGKAANEVAISEVLSMALHAREDRPVEWWFNEFCDAQRRHATGEAPGKLLQDRDDVPPAGRQ